MEIEPDSELVRQSKKGGINAFGKLCQHYERTAIAIALSILAEWHSAEDAVQSSMLIAFRKLHTLEDDAKFGSWLLTTVRRKAIEMKRQQLPVTSTDFAEKSTPLLVVENKDVSDWIDREFIHELVQKLSEADQLLIGLRYFDGHDFAAIAQILGRPVGSITKQLSRAIKTLEKKVHMEYKHESK